jgi:hypothetical protein
MPLERKGYSMDEDDFKVLDHEWCNNFHDVLIGRTENFEEVH